MACGAKIHRIDVKQIQKTNQYPINDLSKSFGIHDEVTLITSKDFLVVGVSSKVFFIALDRQRFSNEATEINLDNSRKKVSLVYDDYSYSKCIYAGCSGYIYRIPIVEKKVDAINNLPSMRYKDISLDIIYDTISEAGDERHVVFLAAGTRGCVNFIDVKNYFDDASKNDKRWLDGGNYNLVSVVTGEEGFVLAVCNGVAHKLSYRSDQLGAVSVRYKNPPISEDVNLVLEKNEGILCVADFGTIVKLKTNWKFGDSILVKDVLDFRHKDNVPALYCNESLKSILASSVIGLPNEELCVVNSFFSHRNYSDVLPFSYDISQREIKMTTDSVHTNSVVYGGLIGGTSALVSIKMSSNLQWEIELPNHEEKPVYMLRESGKIIPDEKLHTYVCCNGQVHDILLETGEIIATNTLQGKTGEEVSMKHFNDTDGCFLVVGSNGFVFLIDCDSFRNFIMTVDLGENEKKCKGKPVSVEVVGIGGEIKIIAGCNGYLFKIHIDGSIEDINELSGLGYNRVSLLVNTQNQKPGLFIGSNGFIAKINLNDFAAKIKRISLPSCGYNEVSLICDNSFIYAGSNGYVYKLDRESGEFLEKNSLNGMGFNSVEIDKYAKSLVLVIGTNGYLLIIDVNEFDKIKEKIYLNDTSKLVSVSASFLAPFENCIFAGTAGNGYLFSPNQDYILNLLYTVEIDKDASSITNVFAGAGVPNGTGVLLAAKGKVSFTGLNS